MDHQMYWEWISADLDGELSPTQHAQLAAHLQTCPSCMQLYRELSQQQQSLMQLPCTLPPDLHQHILQTLPPQSPTGRPRRIWKVWAPLAACLALFVVLGYVSLHTTQSTTPTTRGSLSPASYAPQDHPGSIPGGDSIIRINQTPSPSLWDLLHGYDILPLEGAYQCCVVSPQIAQQVLRYLQEEHLPYTQAPAPTPDGSGLVSIIWPVS